MIVVVQDNAAIVTLDRDEDALRWRSLYPKASHLVRVDTALNNVCGGVVDANGQDSFVEAMTLQQLIEIGGVPESRDNPPSAGAVFSALGISPLDVLDVITEAQSQRNAGLYPMRKVDGSQVFANGVWQWVPAEKKDWVFDANGNRVEPEVTP